MRLEPATHAPAPRASGTPESLDAVAVEPKTSTFEIPVPLDGVLTARREFELPRRLLDTHEQRCARMRKRAKPAFYHTIKRNRFVSRVRMYGTTQPCQCDPATGNCGESCMNRMMQIVCHPRTCPCGSRCTNGSLGKRPAPELQVAYVRPPTNAVRQARIWAPHAGRGARRRLSRRVLRRAHRHPRGRAPRARLLPAHAKLLLCGLRRVGGGDARRGPPGQQDPLCEPQRTCARADAV